MSETTTILVSPAEPAHVKNALAALDATVEVSPLPERFGVDFLWRARGAWWGVQRKTISDLLASLRDGRITREVMQMKSKVSMPTLLIEGRVQFTSEAGEEYLVAHSWSRDRFSRRQWRGLMWTFGSHGVQVDSVANTTELARYIVELAAWSEKAKHTSVTARPKAVDSAWGKANNRDFGVFFLQGIDGIGAGVAADIYDHFGRVPMRWDVDRDELLAVKGLGPKRVDRMLEVFA